MIASSAYFYHKKSCCAISNLNFMDIAVSVGHTSFTASDARKRERNIGNWVLFIMNRRCSIHAV